MLNDIYMIYSSMEIFLNIRHNDMMYIIFHWLRFGVDLYLYLSWRLGEGCININMTINRTAVLMSSPIVDIPNAAAF